MADLQKNSHQPDKHSGITLFPVKTYKDLTECVTIATQIKAHGEKAVKLEIASALDKLTVGLNINLSTAQFEILLDDLADLYKHDSLEDLIMCFKKARQGLYGWGHEKRGVLNMLVIKSWMAEHLEAKAIEREKAHEEIKKGDTKLKGVDYESYKKRMAEEKKKPKKDPTKEETEYQVWKENYLRNKKTNKR
jgi:hypothetical protein